MHKRFRWNTVVWCGVLGLASGILVSGLACGGAATPTTLSSGAGDGLLDNPLSFGGSISGKLSDSASTRDSLGNSSAAQSLPPDFETADTMVRFTDLNGQTLRDPSGASLPDVTVNEDGTFDANGLPVGVDFVLCGDIGRDGTCDLETIINIPADETGSQGRLTDVRADPLTKIVLEKLRRIIEENGFNIEDLPISPTAVAARIISAFDNLFDETGIDQTLNLQDLDAQASGDLAELFDTVVPPAVQTGMDIVEGNLGLSVAKNADEVALAAAEVFLRAGFPILDLPGGPDFSPLAQLDGIRQATKEEVFGGNDGVGRFDEGPLGDLLASFGGELPPEVLDAFPDGIPNDLTLDDVEALLGVSLGDGLLDGLNLDNLNLDGLNLPDPAGQALEPADPFGDNLLEGNKVFYINETSEPDRNFSNAEGVGGVPQLPVFTDRILRKMAVMHLEGRRLTLGALHELLTSLEDGLGARLTFFVEDPNFFGPPLTIFETADGNGKALELERLFRRIFEAGFSDVDESTFDRQESELRALLKELLGDTLPPSFERLFDGFITDRLAGAEVLADRIREARAHLPFNNTGPRSFFVVGNGDPFSDTPATAITVDATVSSDGTVTSVTFNPNGTGAYYLGFTERTEKSGRVELIVRETGRPLHSARGPVRLSIFNEAMFASVDGMPFADVVSQTGTFFPGTSVSINVRRFEPGGGGDNIELREDRIFVLATDAGDSAEPVRVDYDPVTGLATVNPRGRQLLSFLPDSEQTGFFALFNEDTGRDAFVDDPKDFFDAPPEVPADFEMFFNDPEAFNDFEQFDSVDEFVNATFDEPNPVDPSPDGLIDPLLDPEATTTPDAQTTIGSDTTSETSDTIAPAEFDGLFDPNLIIVAAADIVGLDLAQETFTRVFGVEVPNPRHDPSADPFYDDINGNNMQDPNEPTSPFRPTLFDARDWRATDIPLYYRRADNGGPVTFEDVDFESPTPRTLDGVELVARDYRPRLNAFRFGRPNTAINLLTAFSPPELFDGTRGFNRDTPVDVFSAVGVINLVMDQVFNIEANVDIDGLGPLPSRRMLVEARMFVVPLDDPFILLAKGFRARSTVGGQAQGPQ